MLELKGTVAEAASECLSSISEAPQIGGVTNKCSSKKKNKNKKQVAMKRPKCFSPKYTTFCDHTIVRKMKGPRLDVDAICASMLEGYEKNKVLWAAKQQLEAAATHMGPSSRKKNETTKRKMKKNKRSKMKIPFNF
ncbi:hypothetical protein MtrunA17_Chr8g0342011 [Medicago truncatula]|uniref:Uncharacterized protein n=2 Tax=Medicago truncatula TaxID=3880 RepID=A0A396GCQ8_MEDTR|nr:uncharacterized protein LOC25500444 [Medicago truncatula]XP_024628329.1 uncharacterized protein LOC25500444 [Medicago truncatula]RHN39269.1 hypothetical protein MtrunA17_Chr8g0342011 [Medicago truncatula]